MTLSLYRMSIPALIRGLDNFSHILRRGADHAAQAALDADALVQARLAEDMLPLAGQVQRASDTAKFAAARLAGIEAPSFPDDEATMAQLLERIARTAAFLRGVREDDFPDDDDRQIAFRAGRHDLRMTATDYVSTFALPNFYFHVATGYDILRSRGVPLGKLDYLRGADA